MSEKNRTMYFKSIMKIMNTQRQIINYIKFQTFKISKFRTLRDIFIFVKILSNHILNKNAKYGF